jgi:hydroxyacylglutathione hydrolase
MLFRLIYDDMLAQAAYLIGCQRTGDAILFDPERDVDRCIAIAAKEGVRIVAVAETHIHADFLSGARELAEQLDCTVYVSDEGDADWRYQWLGTSSRGRAYRHRLLKHGDTFGVGAIQFTVLHTPGHTPEHVCYLVTDRGGGATEPMGIISGDFLFVGDLGRPDLLESAAGFAGQADASAKRLYQTVKSIASLPDYLQVWPGHGAGSACGKALGAVPQSTLGYERRFNAALLAAASEREFTQFILEGQPEPPLYFARMKRENRDGPKVLGELPRPRELSAEEVIAISDQMDSMRNSEEALTPSLSRGEREHTPGSGVAIVDTRPWAQFKAGHVPGSLFHPLNNSFATDAGSMIAENEAIYLITEPHKVDAAVRALVRIGLDDIHGFFDARKLNDYAAGGGRLASTAELAPAQARALGESRSAFHLDVRRATEFAEGHIPGAMNIAHTRLLSRLNDVPRDRPIVVNCRSGGRSARACALLQKHGYDVVNLEGGYMGWEQAATHLSGAAG